MKNETPLILLIEDNSRVRASQIRHLESCCAFRVVGFSSAAEVYDLPGANRADLVIVDDYLPEAFGPHTINRLREGNPGLLAILTSDSGSDALAEMREQVEGQCATVGSTFPIVPLVKTVWEVLDFERPLILVVEDEPALRTLFGKVLEVGGYRVMSFVSGAELLAEAEPAIRAATLVIIDNYTATMFGSYPLNHLREINPTIKAIFISGTERDVLENVFSSVQGQYFFMQLPFRPSELISTVRKVITDHTDRE